MNELEIRIDEMRRLYMAVGRVLGEQARCNMAAYCLARIVELHASEELLSQARTIHDNN